MVLEGGLTTDWFALQNQVAPFTRVCSWDHPNGPWSRSDPAPTPRTARDFVADLHALLRVAHVPGPYVLAGHSNGGLYTQLGRQHPPPAGGRAGADRRRASRLPQANPGVASGRWCRPRWEAVRQDAITPDHRLLDPERVDIWTSERQTRRALRRSPLRPMPLVVLTRGHPDVPGAPFVEQQEALWLQLQRELACWSPAAGT